MTRSERIELWNRISAMDQTVTLAELIDRFAAQVERVKEKEMANGRAQRQLCPGEQPRRRPE